MQHSIRMSIIMIPLDVLSRLQEVESLILSLFTAFLVFICFNTYLLFSYPTSSLNFPVYDVGSVGGGGVHDDLVTTTAAAAADTDCNVERKKAGGALPDGHTCI